MLGTSEYPVYLVKSGDEAAIFEGGVGACGPLVAEQLAVSGVSADSVKQVLITHAHPDHVMAVPAFREMFPNVAICASEIAAATLSVEKAVGFFSKIDGTWEYNDYTYSCVDIPTGKAAMTSPANGSTLSSSTSKTSIP